MRTLERARAEHLRAAAQPRRQLLAEEIADETSDSGSVRQSRLESFDVDTLVACHRRRGRTPPPRVRPSSAPGLKLDAAQRIGHFATMLRASLIWRCIERKSEANVQESSVAPRVWRVAMGLPLRHSIAKSRSGMARLAAPDCPTRAVADFSLFSPPMRILMAKWDAAGGFPPERTIIRGLVARGHDVHVAAHTSLRSRV
jgi:hypothetical protein